jgi:hypothetical protein
MNKYLIGIPFLLAAATSAHAADDYAKALMAAATGPTITVASTPFRIVPGVGIAPAGSAGSAGPAAPATHRLARTAASEPADSLGTVGPFAIVPKATASAQAARASASTAATTAPSGQIGKDDLSTFGVAVNMRTQQPAVVAPRLKVFATDAKTIAALAKQTHGTVVYASDMDGSGLIRYASVDQAQAALATVKAGKGVDDAFVDVIESFRQKQ